MNSIGKLGTALFLAFVAMSLIASAPCFADVHLTVGTLGQGAQYTTVQAAVDAVPDGNIERHTIDIKPGTYMERVKIPTTKPFITFRGEDPLTTKLTFNKPANATPNDNRNWASTVIEGEDFIAENLTFENSYGTGVQALALYAKADRLIFNNCRFLGNQDTLRSESGRHYFYNSYVEGTVDFIYGSRGTAYFEDSTIYAKSSGYLTAQGREQPSEPYGYVFKNATIIGSAANGSVYLGRPWEAYSRVVFIDSKMGPVIKPAGWSTWSGNNHLTSYYAEYNSSDLNGEPLDVSQRVSWSHQLMANEIDPFSKENWLAGGDGWNPVINVITGSQGDFNDDGIVDAADYTMWRNHLGDEDEFNINFKGDGIGGVDLADYDVWKANYGNSRFGSGGLSGLNSQNVPEPTSILLTTLLSVSAMARRRQLCRSYQQQDGANKWQTYE